MSGALSEETAPHSLDSVAWQPSYDREAVERFLADTGAERRRLETDLRAAQAHLDEMARRQQALDVEETLRLADLARAAGAELRQIEDEHRRAVEAVKAAAALEVAALARSGANDDREVGS